MKTVLWIVAAALLLAVLASVWVRLAPARAGDWHKPPAEITPRKGGKLAVFCPAPGSRYAEAGAPDLARFDDIALADPRTTRAFGGPETGLTTYVTRSRLMGYPDYTTVGLHNGQICVVARQRFGLEDMGVNARRIKGWAMAYSGLLEPPEITARLP